MSDQIEVFIVQSPEALIIEVDNGIKGEKGDPGSSAVLPTGGTYGQVLVKNSSTDGDASFADGLLITTVRNKTGSTLTAGTVVYIDGAQGNLPTVAKALATSDATSAQTYGLVAQDIADNASGPVVQAGQCKDLNTSALTEGVQLYLSPTTAGTYTTTKPSAPNHIVYIGICTRSHPTLGTIEVRVQNGYELDEIHDVSISSPTNKQALTYNSSTGLWNNYSLTAADVGAQASLGFTPENVANKDNGSLSTSSTTYPTSGAVKTYVDNAVAGVTVADATTTSKGIVQLAGDLSGTATAPTVPALANKANTSTTVSTSAPLSGGGDLSANRTISISQASTTTDGYLSSSDFNTFNNKQSALGFTPENVANKDSSTALGTSNTLYPTQGAVKSYVDTGLSGRVPTTRTISTTAPLAGGGDLSANRTISITLATTSTDGYLSRTDWNTFNNKQASLGFTPENVANKDNGSLSTSTTTYPTSGAVKTYVDNTTIPKALNSAQILVGNASNQAAAVSMSGDTTISNTGSVTINGQAVTFTKIQNVNNQRLLGRKSAGSGSVEETTTSEALDWVGSTRGQILYRGATGWAVLSPGTSGQLLQTNGAGADPSWVTASGGGGISSLNSQTGASQTFTNDTNVTITSASNNHTLGWSGTLAATRGGTGTGTFTTGDILYSSATNTLSKLPIGTSGQVLTVSSGVPAWQAVSGTGTVTSVGLSLPSEFNVTGSPVTSSGTLTATLANQNANTVLAGPSSGGAATPTFRSLTSGDIPALPYVSNTLTSGNIIVGNASNTAASVTMSGDATISNTGVLTISNNAVTDADLRDSTALSVIGRSANSSGDPGDISAGTDHNILRRSGTSLGFGSIDLSQSGAVGTSRLGYSNLAQGSARSVLGVTGNATGDVASIQGTADQVLRVDSAGTGLRFGQIVANGIADGAVTFTKIQNVSNQRILGRNSAGSGSVEENTTSQVLDWIGSTQGQILYRGASGWAVLAPGTSGQLLQTNGTGADPSWVTASGGGGISSLNSQTGASQTFANDTNITITSASNTHTLGWSGTLAESRGGTGTGTYSTGDILYASASNTLSKLTIGSSGQVLTVSSGVPTWAAAGGGGVTAGTNIENISGTVSALTKTISPTSLVSFENDYAPTGWGTDVSVVRLTASNFIFLTGLSAGATNQIVELRNVGTVSIGLMTKSTDSTAANRFDFGDEDFIIFPGYSVRLVYDGTDSRWKRADQYEWWSVSTAFATHYIHDAFSNAPTATTTNEFGAYVGNGTLSVVDVTAPTTYYQQGVLSLAHSATVGSRHSWYSNNNTSFSLRNATGIDGSYWSYESSVMFGTLSDSTNRYYFQSGLFDSVTANPNDAVMVTYRDDENSGAFILRAHNNSTTVTTDANSTVTVAANTWYRVKVSIYPNATARLFVNGNFEVALIAGLPVNRNIGYGVSIRKIAGTLARSLLLDYTGVSVARGGRF